VLRCAAEEAPADLGDWWTRFMHAGEEERELLVQSSPALRAPGTAPRRRRRRGRRGSGEGDAAAIEAQGNGDN
jgi:poly(A) polymerase